MTTTIKDKLGVEVRVGQECEAYNSETGVYFNGEVVGLKDNYISVEDMEGNVFDIEYHNIEVEVNIKEIAEEESLEYIETTIGLNGYPKALKFALTGFRDFEHAQEVADKYGLSVESFRRQDGQSLWQRDNATMFKPYQNSASKYGDDYGEISKMDEADFMELEVDDVLKYTEFENLDALERLVEIKKQLWEEVDVIEDDEIVITYQGEYYETIKRESMDFSHDTWNYIIGVI